MDCISEYRGITQVPPIVLAMGVAPCTPIRQGVPLTPRKNTIKVLQKNVELCYFHTEKTMLAYLVKISGYAPGMYGV